jgi:hypothetical protein
VKPTVSLPCQTNEEQLLKDRSLMGTDGFKRAHVTPPAAGRRESLRYVLARFAPAFVPLGFAVWLAHYSFHFATGALTIVPVSQNFALDHGLEFLGSSPNWGLGEILPATWLLPIQILAVLAGFLGSLSVLGKIGRRARVPQRATFPWLLLLLAVALAAVTIFTLPMEMRGTVQLSH